MISITSFRLIRTKVAQLEGQIELRETPKGIRLISDSAIRTKE